MTKESCSNEKEQNEAIAKAVKPGVITLATEDFARGRDFICRHRRINMNGGVHVLATYFPELESLLIQMMRRGARQGEDGSFSMVILRDELKKRFEIDDRELDRIMACDNIYDELKNHLKNWFEKTFQKLILEDEKNQTKIHEPSVLLWRELTAPNRDMTKIIELIKILNPAQKPQLSLLSLNDLNRTTASFFGYEAHSRLWSDCQRSQLSAEYNSRNVHYFQIPKQYEGYKNQFVEKLRSNGFEVDTNEATVFAYFPRI